MQSNMHKKDNKLSSNKGAAITIIAIGLIPFILIITLFAIDISVYVAMRTKLQNALDVSVAHALNNSTLDNYRADQQLKIITDNNSDNSFTNRLIEAVEQNFDTGGVNTNGNTLTFVPGFSHTKGTATIQVQYNKTEGTVYKKGESLSESYATSVGTTLTTQIKLPAVEKLSKFFGGGDIFDVDVTLENNIRGSRVKKSDDFHIKYWETP